MSLGLARSTNRALGRGDPSSLSRTPSRRPAPIGNQERLKRLRSGASTSRDRCDAGRPCEQDEGRKRDPSGIATCNPTTGVVETTVFKEQCVGDCIAQHENTHAKDDGFCCKTYADCVKNASGVDQRNACRDKWVQYADANRAATECNAYTVEQQCMNNLIVQNCGVDAKAGKECCDGLRKEQAVVNARQAAFCGGPSGSPVLMPCGVYFR